MISAFLVLIGVAAAGAADTIDAPRWNKTKCPAFWEMQAPHMKHDFDIREFEGFYYELALHDVTQFPLCPGKSKCITSEKKVETYPDGVRFVNDTWNLQCLGQKYPQELLFNITKEPGFLLGYERPGKGAVTNIVFPDTIVDFKAGPSGWALEVQCKEALGRVVFVGINFYARQKTVAAYQEILAAAHARGLGFYMDSGFGLRRVDHSDCPDEPRKSLIV